MINRSVTTNETRYKFTPDVGSPVEYEVEYLGTVVGDGGTDLNDVTLLNDTVAGRYGLDALKAISDPADPLFASPNNAFKIIKDMLDDMINMVYPIGTIYQTDVIASAGAMNTQFGGTWIAWGVGRVPVGFDATQTEFNTVNKTGGNKLLQAHTHSTPNHVHTIPDHAHTTPNHVHTTGNTTAVNGETTSTMVSGGGGTSGAPSNNTSGSTTAIVNSETDHTHSFSDAVTSGGGTDHDHGIGNANSDFYAYGSYVAGTAHYDFQRLSTISYNDDYCGIETSHTHSVSVSGTTGTGSTHTHTTDAHTHTLNSHTHTTPAHTHTMNAHNHTQSAHSHSILSSGGGTSGNAGAGNTGSGGASTSGSTGGGASENLQPYQVCYFWKRTA